MACIGILYLQSATYVQIIFFPVWALFLLLSLLKKGAAIILLGIYMFSFSELHQFLKIPILFQHFTEHRLINPGITFAAFLDEHYLQGFVMDDDYQRDNQLPFRSADCVNNSFTSFDYHHNEIGVVLIRNYEEDPREFVVMNEDSIPHLSVTDIFQPPRLA